MTKYIWIFCTVVVVGLYIMITVTSLEGMRKDVEMAKLGYVQEQQRGAYGLLWVKPAKDNQQCVSR